MATAAIRIPHRERFIDWFWEFLRQELRPYPGRGAIVARMVISATLSMIIIVTFRIPGGVIGALCAFILSRENLLSTAKTGFYIVVAFAIGALFIPIGARMLASIPFTHFLWEGVSLFVVFFLLRTLTNFALATYLSLVTTFILSTWYLPGPAEHNVELTLWQVLATFIGAMVTISVEVIFHAFRKRNELTDGIDDRLRIIETLLKSYAAGQPVAPETERALAQYGIIGVGALRRYIARANYDQLHQTQMSAVASLTGRCIDFAAALSSTTPSLPPSQYQRAGRLASRIAELRESFRTNSKPGDWDAEGEDDSSIPLLSELGVMVSFIPSIFQSAASIDPRLQVLDTAPPSKRLFVEDAFSNPEHLRFVVAGTLASMLCYILYVSLDWPGISAAVTTCALTALTNIGASRQKQILRISGAVVGGFVFGLGSQVFILPYIDSITGFTVLFAVVSACAAWVSTSSPRLSYAGLQIVVAYYFINLTEFSIQLSLSAARDRAVGVLLGISMMWLVFERFYPKPASDEMVSIFIRNLRLLGDLISGTSFGMDTNAVLRVRRQRDQVYRYFGEVNAQADAVPFETGPARAAHMAARDRIRRWQATLRTFYLLYVPLFQLRAFGDFSEISAPFFRMEDQIRQESVRALTRMADSLESQLGNRPFEYPPHPELRLLLESQSVAPAILGEREQGLLRLAQNIAAITNRLENDVASTPLFATD